MVTAKSERTSSRKASNSSPVQLVDQEDRGPAGPHRCEQGTLHEEISSEQVVHVRGGFARLHRPDRDELAGVVPFVQGLTGVDAFVALQADQVATQGRGQGLCDLRLADARLSFKQ